MSRALLLFTLVIFGSSAFAQEGFFLQTEVGIGKTKVFAKSTLPPSYIHIIESAQKPTFDIHASAGYAFNKWVVSSGILFTRTHSFSNIEVWQSGITTDKYDYRFYYIGLPILVGYQIICGSKLSIVPFVGTDLTFNFVNAAIDESHAGVNHHENISINFLETVYTRYACWAFAEAKAHYVINENFNIVAGPEVQYSITSLLKKNTNTYGRDLIYTFNVGIKWHISRQVKKPQPDVHANE